MKIFKLAVLFFMFTSCQGPLQNSEAQKLFEETMFIHDEVMPEMGTMHKLRKKLRKKLDSTELDSTNRKNILNSIQALEKADDEMMEWMAEFKKPEDTPEAVNYLKNEKIKISAVKESMLKSIENAKHILNE